MTYTVSADSAIKINLAPQTLVDEVLQNIMMILSTPQYTVPLDRNFGMSYRFVDKPAHVAEALIISEVYEAIEKYEPRAEVVDITFERDEMAGKMVPRVEVKINAGE